MEKHQFNKILAFGIIILVSVVASTWFVLDQMEKRFTTVDEKLVKTESDIAGNKGLIQGVNSEIALVKDDTDKKLDTIDSKLDSKANEQDGKITQIQQELGIQLTQLEEQTEALATQSQTLQTQSEQLQDLEQKEAQEKVNIENAKKSVVILTYSVTEDDTISTQTFSSICSGVIYKQEGNKVYVVTNQHCVGWEYLGWAFFDSSESGEPEIISETLEVSTINGVKHTVDQITKAKDNIDLATITFTKQDGESFSTTSYEPALPIVGDEVIAIGSPSGLSYTTTKGIVSAFRQAQYIENGQSVDLVQTDAAINPGNSGGGLFRLSDGKLIGINSFIYSNTEGLNFAISSKSFISTLGP